MAWQNMLMCHSLKIPTFPRYHKIPVKPNEVDLLNKTPNEAGEVGAGVGHVAAEGTKHWQTSTKSFCVGHSTTSIVFISCFCIAQGNGSTSTAALAASPSCIENFQSDQSDRSHLAQTHLQPILLHPIVVSK